jgi:hypothetical protein
VDFGLFARASVRLWDPGIAQGIPNGLRDQVEGCGDLKIEYGQRLVIELQLDSEAIVLETLVDSMSEKRHYAA